MINGFPKGVELQFMACPHQATLLVPQAGEIMPVSIDMDCPELVAVRNVIDKMTNYRRPPDRLVRLFNERMRALTHVLERRALREMAMAN